MHRTNTSTLSPFHSLVVEVPKSAIPSGPGTDPVAGTHLVTSQSPVHAKLGHWAGRAQLQLSLLKRQVRSFLVDTDGVLQVKMGHVWVTVDQCQKRAIWKARDHVLTSGKQLSLQAGRRVIIEAWLPEHMHIAELAWLPVVPPAKHMAKIGATNRLGDLLRMRA